MLEKGNLMKKSTKIILGIGATCAAIYSANRIFHHLATSKKLLPVTGSSIYKWTHGDIHYIKKGSGSPLLLLHHIDFFGSSYEFQKSIDELAENHTVYALDFLGCGRSQKEKMEYTNFLYVQLVCNFAEDVIGEKCSIVTSGNASNVGIMASKYRSELFDQLVLVNPVDIYEAAPDYNKIKLCKLIFEIPLFGTFAYNLASSRCRLEKILKNSFYKPEKCSNRLIDIYLEAAHLGDANAKYLYASLVGNYLAANTVPVLKAMDNLTIIVGEKEMDQTETVTHYKELVQNTKVITIPKTGKLPGLEAPESFVTAVTKGLE